MRAEGGQSSSRLHRFASCGSWAFDSCGGRPFAAFTEVACSSFPDHNGHIARAQHLHVFRKASPILHKRSAEAPAQNIFRRIAQGKYHWGCAVRTISNTPGVRLHDHEERVAKSSVLTCRTRGRKLVQHHVLCPLDIHLHHDCAGSAGSI